jgi:hypothetical protein
MPRPPERRRWHGVAGYALFLVCVCIGLAPVYVYVEATYRAAVVRAGAVLVLWVALTRLRRAVRRHTEGQPPSAFEGALNRSLIEPHMAPIFVKLRDEVRVSTSDQEYFENTLWLRMQRMIARRDRPAGRVGPAMPSGRRWLRRGPSLAALRDLITRMEEPS